MVEARSWWPGGLASEDPRQLVVIRAYYELTNLLGRWQWQCRPFFLPGGVGVCWEMLRPSARRPQPPP